MWPWDHLAAAYLCYSGWLRLRGRRLTELPAMWLAFGSQFPDLVDKPLSWGFGAVPVFTHTLVVAIPLWIGVLFFGRLRNQDPSARAFVFGYLSHLTGDLLYPLATDGVLGYRRLLWPLVSFTGDPGAGLLETTLRYFRSHLEFLTMPGAVWYVAADLALIVGALALWRADGMPGKDALRSFVSER